MPPISPDDFYLTIAGHMDQKVICSVVRRGKKVRPCNS